MKAKSYFFILFTDRSWEMFANEVADNLVIMGGSKHGGSGDGYIM